MLNTPVALIRQKGSQSWNCLHMSLSHRFLPRPLTVRSPGKDAEFCVGKWKIDHAGPHAGRRDLIDGTMVIDGIHVPCGAIEIPVPRDERPADRSPSPDPKALRKLSQD